MGEVAEAAARNRLLYVVSLPAAKAPVDSDTSYEIVRE